MAGTNVSKSAPLEISDTSNAALLAAATNEVGVRGIPTITSENAAGVANFIFGPGSPYSQTVKAELMLTMIKRVAFVIDSNLPYTNKLRAAWAGNMRYGDSVEEFFVDIADVNDYDPIAAQAEAFEITPDKTYTALHQINSRKNASVTIALNEIPRYFLNEGGVYEFINSKVMSMFNAKEDYEFKTTLGVIGTALTNGYTAVAEIPTLTLANTEQIVATILEWSQNMTELNRDLNYAGVASHAPLDDQVLLMTNEFYGLYKVKILASLFHNDEAAFYQRTFTFKEIPGFPDIPVILASRKWLQIYSALEDVLYNINGVGATVKYTLHFWDLFSASPFVPVIAFNPSGVGTVTSVTVTPAAPSIAKGGSQQFAAALETEGTVNQGVTWSLTGATSPYTRLTFDGLLYVGEDESGTLAVTATSIETPTKSGSTTSITLT